MLGSYGLVGCEAEPPPLVRSPEAPVAGWPIYGGDAAGTRYSPLTEIDRNNVSGLQPVWTFHTGDFVDGKDGRPMGAFQVTPVLFDDVLIFCSPRNRVFAIDAQTGEERWRYDPKIREERPWGFTCRGVATWIRPDSDEKSACSERVFTATNDARLIALDARTGVPCGGFGAAGVVDLTVGVSNVYPGEYGVTSPPTVIGGVVAVGALVADNRRVDAPSGVVRGFDVETGALRWSFDPVPPGTPPRPPGPNGEPSYHIGTANAWSIFSADPERDLLFVPTGNTSPDFFGGLRHGIDYYSSSVVALRGQTGDVVWHFQTVHHDVWDYDVASQPLLIDVETESGWIPAVVQGTKMGHIFILHRETGVPLFPVEERAVPQGAVAGETLSPTQPFPSYPPPLHPKQVTTDDAWGFTPLDRSICRGLIEQHRSEGMFTPPSLEGTLQFPGTAGGMNWGGIAYDPVRRLLVTNLNKMPNVLTLIPQDEVGSVEANPPFLIYFAQEGTPYAVAQGVLISPLGVPCTTPPWGTVLAFDLGRERLAWEEPLGTTRDLAPVPISLPLGLPNMGGPIATASGVIFIGAAMDDYLRAYDSETGEELWKGRLPGGGQATPMTYRAVPGGRQFVVIAAGGHATLGTTQGDALVAFALP